MVIGQRQWLEGSQTSVLQTVIYLELPPMATSISGSLAADASDDFQLTDSFIISLTVATCVT